MNNLEVVKKFLNGEQGATAKRTLATGGTGRTLYTQGNKLINYNTVIATLNGTEEQTKEVEVDATYYSNTTSKIQTSIIKQVNAMRRTGHQMAVCILGDAKRVEWLSGYIDNE